MWRRRGGNGSGQRATRERHIRDLLAAASARDEELPGLSPFLVPRVRGLAAAQVRAAAARPVGMAAWRALPVAAALTLVLVAWAGIETARARQLQREAVAQVVSGSAEGDALLAAAVLLAAGDAGRGGGR
jgi:hypothetical protein